MFELSRGASQENSNHQRIGERLNREVKCRTRLAVLFLFPNADSALRLVNGTIITADAMNTQKNSMALKSHGIASLALAFLGSFF